MEGGIPCERKARYVTSSMVAAVKSLAPGFLIATPQLQDSNFHQAVVLMIEHSDEGSMGLCINRTAPLTFRELAKSQELKVAKSRRDDALYHGGPVEPYRGFVLHDSDRVDERNEILPGLYLSVTGDSLTPLMLDERARVRFCLGYSGWAAGQIEFEMKQGSWLYTEADRDTVWLDEPRHIWDQVMKSMGFDPGWVVPSGGVN
jgi:putative transcriptional regulator